MKLFEDKQFNPTRENISKILNDWNIFEYEAEELKNGVENISLKIITKDKNFVLRIYRQNNKASTDIQTELDFMVFLFGNKITVPRLYKNINGSLISKIEIFGNTWFSILMEYVDGDHCNFYTKELAGDLGRLLAKMHLASIDFCKENNDKCKFKNLTNDFLDKVDIEKIKNPDIKIFITNAGSSVFKITNLPSAFIHSDLTSDNFIVLEDKIKAVIDFDDMHFGNLILDFAITGRDILALGSKELFENFFTEYNNIRKIADEEKAEMKYFLHLRNYFVGTFVLYLFGEESDEIKIALTTEKVIDEID